jgi:hypothetical protein
MKYQPKWQRNKKDIKLTHEFYNELLDNAQSGTVKIARQLREQGTDDKDIFMYLRNVACLTYGQSIQVIKRINDER